MRFDILKTLLLIPGILVGLTFHEYAHAITADRLGDKTPRFQGRLTLNPLVHIDPIGFIMILIFGFGWAKPVQVNPSAFKRYYKDDLKVTLAGPVANLIVAILSALIYGIFSKFTVANGGYSSMQWIISMILVYSVTINCALFVLNLIPIPGFDGFHILRDLFPKFFYKFAEQVYRYQFIIMIVFLATPLAGIIIGVPAGFVSRLMFKLADLI
ncbi:site-2 protease family protein [Clostridium swellfunianum]|uniref:site-2 protease family protein n=1 Tax=Clostridium swellfunianum TaxID=1367462 RepID=UPI002030AA4B|nr:site-2 protease family protein [Clostridium swellfunianum]MCM0649857.1 site-2 protease family protein [Clostridium swellfunianum]